MQVKLFKSFNSVSLLIKTAQEYQLPKSLEIMTNTLALRNSPSILVLLHLHLWASLILRRGVHEHEDPQNFSNCLIVEV
jgi:hypothetical protein